MHVGILLFEGVDLLDAGGPYEVFLTANRLALRTADEAPFSVTTVTHDGRAVAAYGGLRLTPHASIDEAGKLDVVIIPGTVDVERALADEKLAKAVSDLAAQAHLTTSVCTGAFFLAQNGDLAGRAWTTHWEDIDDLAKRIGSQGARRGVRWVDSGAVITSGGLACGIDMALHVVERVAGRELAQQTATQLDAPWRPDGNPG